MNTTFQHLEKTLTLTRFPAHLQHQSWQAWDAADEYIIDYLEANDICHPDKRMAIYNDEFGALACWFAPYVNFWVNDSYVAQTSCMQNLAANQVDGGQIAFLNCLTPPAGKLDIVVLKIPKTTALLEHQLIQLQPLVTPQTTVIAAGKARLIPKSMLALFEKYLGTTTTSLAKKKARLVFCQPQGNKSHANPYPTVWSQDTHELTLLNHANVFARQQLDIGARLLMENLPDCSGKTVVDLGCGNGIIGLSVLKIFDPERVIFVDESHMAVASAEANVKHNFPALMARCQFIHGNCLDGFAEHGISSVDIVLCNPPFHQLNTITDHIAWQMFSDAKKYLRPNGELRIIGNRHLDYPQKLKRLFGGYRVINSDKKFSILSSLKR